MWELDEVQFGRLWKIIMRHNSDVLSYAFLGESTRRKIAYFFLWSQAPQVKPNLYTHEFILLAKLAVLLRLIDTAIGEEPLYGGFDPKKVRVFLNPRLFHLRKPVFVDVRREKSNYHIFDMMQ